MAIVSRGALRDSTSIPSVPSRLKRTGPAPSGRGREYQNGVPACSSGASSGDEHPRARRTLFRHSRPAPAATQGRRDRFRGGKTAKPEEVRDRVQMREENRGNGSERDRQNARRSGKREQRAATATPMRQWNPARSGLRQELPPLPAGSGGRRHSSLAAGQRIGRPVQRRPFEALKGAGLPVNSSSS